MSLLLTGYAKRTMRRTLFLCRQGQKNTKADFPQLSGNPGFLTNSVTKPIKSAAVQNFVSRFNKKTEAVGRPEAQVVEPEVKSRPKRNTRSKEEGAKNSKKRKVKQNNRQTDT